MKNVLLVIVAFSVEICGLAVAADAPLQQIIRLEGSVVCTAPNERFGAAMNVVNGSSINEDGFHPFEHWDGAGGGHGMWITDAGGGGSSANNPAGLDCSTWLRYDFDTVYPLGVM